MPKLKWPNICGYRNTTNITGKIMNATISRKINKYYVSLVIDVVSIKNMSLIPRSIVGIDIGIKKLLTLSDATTFDNNKYILKYEKRIKRLQENYQKK